MNAPEPEVVELADAIADAYANGIKYGSYSLARWLIQAGYRAEAHGFLSLKDGERCPVAKSRELLGARGLRAPSGTVGNSGS